MSNDKIIKRAVETSLKAKKIKHNWYGNCWQVELHKFIIVRNKKDVKRLIKREKFTDIIDDKTSMFTMTGERYIED